jgi:hypothetical protein
MAPSPRVERAWKRAEAHWRQAARAVLESLLARVPHPPGPRKSPSVPPAAPGADSAAVRLVQQADALPIVV